MAARHLHRPPPLQARKAAGFTLLEACLACGALSFGLLALAQLQSALQASVEAARERGQAIRLGQATLERQRRYAALEAAEGATAYAQVVSFRESAPLAGEGARAATLQLDITEHPALHHKAARVTVTWHDRLGRLQAVRLDTLIAGVPP